MIGEITYSLNTKTNSSAVIFRNFGKATTKISIRNSSKTGVAQLTWGATIDEHNNFPLNEGVGPGKTVIFTIKPDWTYIKASSFHRDGPINLAVSYE